MKNKLWIGFLVVCLILSGFVGVQAYKDNRPILDPTIDGVVYSSIQSAVASAVTIPEDRLDSVLYVFYKNDCKYCRGGIGGVIEAYKGLSDKEKVRVGFYDIDTGKGLALAKTLGVTKTSQMVIMSQKNSVYGVFNYATKNQTTNHKEVREAIEELKKVIASEE